MLYWLGYINLRNIIPLYIKTNILKYLPGGIWHFVARLRTLSIEIDVSNASRSVLLEPLLMLSAAFILVPIGYWKSGISILFFLPAFLFLRMPRNLIVKKIELIKITQFKKYVPQIGSMKSDPTSSNSNLYPFTPLLLEIIFILLKFVSFWYCLKIFNIEDIVPIYNLLSFFSIAWSIGLVIPAAPGGVGIFEISLLFFVGNLLPKAPLLGAILVYRLAVTFSDLLAAAWCFILRKSD